MHGAAVLLHDVLGARVHVGSVADQLHCPVGVDRGDGLWESELARYLEWDAHFIGRYHWIGGDHTAGTVIHLNI